jgi:DNA-binding NarL/FixJ family response regulator
MVGLVLVDDHALLRECLRARLECSPDTRVLHEAGSGAELLKALPKLKPHVIILDVALPDASGIGLIPQIRQIHPRVRIIVLTMHDHVRYVRHALENGADGYVVKGSPFDELERAIETVMQGSTYVSSPLSSKLLNRLTCASENDALAQLSAREFEVLTLLGRGLTVKAAGLLMGISLKTVSTYRTRLMEKLTLSSSGEIVKFALQSGVSS